MTEVAKVRLTTDGHNVYLEAVEAAFGNDIDLGNPYGGLPRRAAEH